MVAARQLAASIGYMALSSYDRSQIACYSRSINARLPIMRGARPIACFRSCKGQKREARAVWARCLRFLAHSPAGDDLGVLGFLARGRRGGVVQGAFLLSGTGQEVVLVHVLSREELEPKLTGDLRLVDSETMSGKEVALTGKVLDAYKEELERYRTMLSRVCADRGCLTCSFRRTCRLRMRCSGCLRELAWLLDRAGSLQAPCPSICRTSYVFGKLIDGEHR